MENDTGSGPGIYRKEEKLMKLIRRSLPISLLLLLILFVAACTTPPNVASTEVPASPTPLPLPGAMATTPAGSTTDTPAAATTEAAVAASGSVEMPAISADLTGASLYALSCAQCHGKDRSGNKFELDGQTIEVPSLAWQEMNNLYTSDPSRGDVPTQLALSITKGQDESGEALNAMMPRWSSLSQAQVQSLVEYLQTAGTGSTQDLTLSAAATNLQGEQLYVTACAACHGVDGAGKTFVKDDNTITTPALSWSDMSQVYSTNPARGSVADQLALAITKGQDESGDALPEMMPRWSFLSQAQVAGLIQYLQTTFK
jgi:mono/diheme cytochrome c family protein